MNPFKFGTVVENNFFTDRVDELKNVKEMLDSENHLVLISPRRYGKSSLINKALTQLARPYILIDMMQIINVEDLAMQMVRGVFRLYPMEKIKHMLSSFRITPTITYKPSNDSWTISISTTSAQSAHIILEDAMELLEKVSTEDARLIVVLDEFQEITEISKDLPKQLRAAIQRQSGINYIFMGSQESMMTDIFEKKISPFYHFGERMTLRKIPHEDFFRYIMERLPDDNMERSSITTDEILCFTHEHPYYTQQLSSAVYRRMKYSQEYDNVVERAIDTILQEHDLDYERLWQSFSRSERRVLISLCNDENPLKDRSVPYTTTASILKKLVKSGYVINSNGYEMEDPFFGKWIRNRLQ